MGFGKKESQIPLDKLLFYLVRYDNDFLFFLCGIIILSVRNILFEVVPCSFQHDGCIFRKDCLDYLLTHSPLGSQGI